MINSIINNKLPEKILEQIICEDSKVSSFFEILFLLPDEKVWQILKDSVEENKEMLSFVGKIKKIEFWPNWSATNETSNTSRVEPDIFISFENLDVIIEAKKDSNNPQEKKQWENEIRSYKEQYNTSKTVYLLAVSGNDSLEKEKMIDVPIYKTTWEKIADVIIENEIKECESQNKNLFKLMRKIFDIYSISFFEGIYPQEYHIPLDKEEINMFNKEFV